MEKKIPVNEQEKDFFVRIFRKLASYKDPYASIAEILKETCEFFGFYCGFVYEADHTQIFQLREQYQLQPSNLAEAFSLDKFLTPEDIEELSHRTGEVVYLNSRRDPMGARFLELFSAQTLVMVPVIFENKSPIALVGMMDRRRPIRLSKREIYDADAVLQVLAGHIKSRVYQKRLEYAHESMKNIINNAGIDIYVNDFESREILFVNKSIADRYGGEDKILGKYCWEFFSEDRTAVCPYCPRQKLVDREGNPNRVYSWDHKSLGGSWSRILSAVCRWVDGRLVHVVSSIDITENKNNEEVIRRMAEHDPLTALKNRRKFMEDFTGELEKAVREGGAGFLLFMDLDDFKAVNDTLGHLAGDELLCAIAAFLAGKAEILGVPYRYGGDEFVILGASKTGEDLDRTRDILLDRFGKPWRLQGQDAYCGISIGAVRFPREEKNAQELVHAADMMMYEVKKSGKHGFRVVE
jgi:diguanylate cyclase (GGDEF)-like protein